MFLVKQYAYEISIPKVMDNTRSYMDVSCLTEIAISTIPTNTTSCIGLPMRSSALIIIIDLKCVMKLTQFCCLMANIRNKTDIGGRWLGGGVAAYWANVNSTLRWVLSNSSNTLAGKLITHSVRKKTASKSIMTQWRFKLQLKVPCT